MDESEQILNRKLDMLCLEREDTIYTIRSGAMGDIESQAEYYKNTLEEIRDLQRGIKQAKLAESVSLEEIQEWNKGITERKRAEENLYYEMKKIIEDHVNEERDFEFEKLKLSNTSKKDSTGPSHEQHARLPKLVITKFQGTHLDWMRFWSQFEEEVDKSNVSQVTKFSFLKKLLLPRVRLLVDRLPFNSEGYERAKNILSIKYGQESEVVNAYELKIVQLPTVHGSNPAKILEFYENLMSSVQSLESMGKLTEIKGYVRTTLDKLPQLRSQLVQFDDNWKNWEFFDLVEALRKWTDRNPVNPSSENTDNRIRRDMNVRTEKFLQTKTASEHRIQQNCVYCSSSDHTSVDCNIVPSIEERKSILSDKRLCFNCTGSKHLSRNCRSNVLC